MPGVSVSHHVTVSRDFDEHTLSDNLSGNGNRREHSTIRGNDSGHPLRCGHDVNHKPSQMQMAED